MMVSAAPYLPPRYNLVSLDQVDSTNLDARRRAENGAPDATIVLAASQNSGRGRRGRVWSSPVGNLYFSIVLRPDYDIANVMQLGFVMANAITECISSVLPNAKTVNTKWPNDVLVSGKKISGILLEGESGNDGKSLEWVIIGVGLNIVSHPGTGEGNVLSTSLADEGYLDGPDSISSILGTITHNFDAGMQSWQNDGFTTVRRKWLERAAGVGEKITVRLPNETISGTFKELDQNGALLLAVDGGGERAITAGDVFMAPLIGEME